MDQKVEIKEEPVWLDGTEAASFDNYELASEMTCLQEETKSKFEEPVQTQMNTFEPVADVKDEINIEEQTVAQLVPCLKEESKFHVLTEKHRSYIHLKEVFICFHLIGLR
ncbi:uncharacterized protein [Anabrus simplex]|uniref:uncharacterized protein n=1 Tax=Anabrus simplex TaxID=316456 RepID=UPI0035A336C9